ncbi:DUF456 domain-containing protein [uncultured Desulfovibrio sp.]|uniref:DUF456 domain-containing protein n=1 Tax=uncultured Desulfovibrio sp. TaxID=167968 RepID=UPI001C39B52F|nr:DUF456 domain-containing protein [uncultured Desulfovibrio sp.]HIX40219.1 DUF456 domain-containing protein [Candidatus Desulfovibrio intestinigallinarum]
MEALLALLGTGFAVVFIIVLGCSVLLNVVGLPANWLILVLAVLWYFGVPQENSMGLWYWIGMCALAVAGEVMETGVQLLKAKRHGSSSAGTLAGMIGGIIGAIVLAPLFFGLGALIGALGGAWLGCLLMELLKGRSRQEAFNAAFGTLVGRFLGTICKCGVGAAMVAMTAQCIWPEGGPVIPPPPPLPAAPLQTVMLCLTAAG